MLCVRRNLHLACECHRNIYFEGRASLGDFYIPIFSANFAETRAQFDGTMVVPRTRTVAGSKAIMANEQY